MTQLISKTDLVRQHMATGDFKRALAIASRFRMLSKEVRGTIQTAWAAATNPHFYREIKKDPDQLVAAGIDALKTLYQ